ncbi:hypothetical protein O6H91_13G102800 [Diphasiastrum complanatum]|uniref:Uncharacterized protein n=1 Tax=Diphasiastrum complanatum TaxID=34168 RepID=A0ACC2BXX3_DIPCM|nr:hypothetical protein O6H91_13G102800 [Diphasiastrum complanatum]
MLISFPEIMLNVGILLGYVSTFCLWGVPVTINRRLMLGLGGLLALALVGGVLIIRALHWLVVQRRTNEAFSVLIKICSSDEEAELDKDLQ